MLMARNEGWRGMSQDVSGASCAEILSTSDNSFGAFVRTGERARATRPYAGIIRSHS